MSGNAGPIDARIVRTRERLGDALVTSGRIRDFLAPAQGHFARTIEQRLGERGATKDKPAVMANALAGALLSLLTSWMDRGRPESPAEMDDLFHRLVWSGAR